MMSALVPFPLTPSSPAMRPSALTSRVAPRVPPRPRRSAAARLWALGSGLCLAAPLGAQGGTPSSPKGDSVPVRTTSAPVATTTRPLTGITSMRALPNGGLFVNDGQRRQLLLFDAALKEAVVLADTAPGAPIPYGTRQLGLLPYQGDSTLLVESATLSLVVLDAQGRTVRVMAPPRTNDIFTLASVNAGSHAFDAKGRLYYRQGNAGGGFGGGAMMFGAGGERGGDRSRGGGNAQGGRPGQGGGEVGGAMGGPPGGVGGGQGGGPGGRGFNPANQPDSVPIVRVDFDTRTADTVTFVKVPRSDVSMTRGEDGGMRTTIRINPLPQADDWALLADGTVAVIRVLDYHVDYYTPDGQHRVGRKLPYDWKRITDDDRTKLIDSIGVLAKAAGARAGGNGPVRVAFEPIAAEKLPDYYPPVRAGTSLADFQGNLWVLPSTSTLSSQIAGQFSQMAGRGGFPGAGGPPAGAMSFAGIPGGGAAGARRVERREGRDSARAGTPPAGTPPAGTPPGGAPAAAGGMPPAAMGMMAAMMNQPPLVYDVVGRDGAMRYRVQLPPGRQLVGFAQDGALYLAARQGRQFVIEKVTLQ